MAAKADEMVPSCWHWAVKGRQMSDKDDRESNDMYIFRRNMQGPCSGTKDSSGNLALI